MVNWSSFHSSKGIERFLGATTNFALETSLLEVSAGQAKYEHSFRSLVWRIPRLPKEGQGKSDSSIYSVY